MKKICILQVLLVVALLVLSIIPGTLAQTASDPSVEGFNPVFQEANSDVDIELPQTAGWFTENRGQVENTAARFVLTGSTCSFAFVESGYLIEFSGENGITTMLEVCFEGSQNVLPKGLEEVEHKSNFFLGDDPAGWQIGVPNFGKLIYRDLYDDIDLVFYTTELGLKYDFLVAPGTSPENICWSYHGVRNLLSDTAGGLLLDTPSGELREAPLFCYQGQGEDLAEVKSQYVIDGNTVSLWLDEYDHFAPLVVDPLIASSFLGGNRSDSCQDIALDSKGNIYITGKTQSTNFPTIHGSFDTTHGGSSDVFISKFNPGCTDLIYSTFVGGDGSEEGSGIFLDSKRNAYVIGLTSSEDFPTSSGCYDDTHNGQSDVFVLKLDQDGEELLYSTFVGGGDSDNADDIVLDSQDAAYVICATRSSDFPTTAGSYDESANGDWDTAVFKLAPDGSDLVYSSFLGGSNRDSGERIVLDASRNAYLVGTTTSDNFPSTPGSYDSTHNGNDDIFVCKLNSEGSELSYSTFIGGESAEWGRDIVLDPMNNAYIIAYDYAARDAALYELSQDGSDIIKSGLVGGSKQEYPRTITLDADGNIYITGQTQSLDFPTTPGCFQDSLEGNGDVFLCKLDGTTLDFLYSSYLGGREDDFSLSSIIGEDGIFHFVGSTKSFDFPTSSDCYDSSHNGDSDIFVFKIDLMAPEASITSIKPDLAFAGEKIEFRGDGTDSGDILVYSWVSSLQGELYTGDEKSFDISTLGLGTHEITFRVQDDDGLWSQEVHSSVTVHEQPVATIVSITPSPGGVNETVQFQGLGEDDGSITTYSWRSTRDGDLYQGLEPGFSLDNLSLGKHFIRLKVMDDNGVWSEEVSEELSVTERPVAMIKEISPTLAVAGEKIWFTAEGSDDGSIEEYVWSSSIDGEFYRGAQFSTFKTDFSPGNHIITLKVCDSSGLWSYEVADILEVNLRPVATIDSVSVDLAATGEMIQFRGSGADAAAIVTYTWDFDASDGIEEDATGEFPTYSYSTPGSYMVTLTVTDAEGITGSTTHVQRVVTLLDSIDDGIGDVRDETDEKVGGHPDIDIRTLRLYEMDNELLFRMEVVGEISPSLLINYYFCIFQDGGDDVTDVDDAEYFVFYVSGITSLQDKHDRVIAEDLEYNVTGGKLDIIVPRNLITGNPDIRFNGVSIELTDFSFVGSGTEVGTGFADFGGDIEETDLMDLFGGATLLCSGLLIVVIAGVIYTQRDRLNFPSFGSSRSSSVKGSSAYSLDDGSAASNDSSELDLPHKEDLIPAFTGKKEAREGGFGTELGSGQMKKIPPPPPPPGFQPQGAGSFMPPPPMTGTEDEDDEEMVPLDEPEPEPKAVRKRCAKCRTLIIITETQRPLVVACPGCQKRYKVSK